MQNSFTADIQAIINSLGDGIYVCDMQRRITYWSESAQRITGWSAEDVLGRSCFDDLLCHIDKDGHRLCGEEYCPLHRAMITGNGSKGPLLVYAKSKEGRRIPMFVSVNPMRDPEGRVVGGVEIFQDASAIIHELERARAIQQLAIQYDLPDDARLRFTTHYIPHGIIGGDYYALAKLGDDQYGMVLADVMGHGIAAALYTMHLSSLWNQHHHLLADPVAFTSTINNELARVVKTDESFATAACVLVDLKNGVARVAGAGGPPVLLTHDDGTRESIESSGLPLAVMEDAPYEEVSVEIRPGDRLLLFSDGVVEVESEEKGALGLDGLVDLLCRQGYPQKPLRMDVLEEALLKYSNTIRLEDDITLIEACLV